MKQERIDELVKAAKERIDGAPGSRGIILLPEEVLELLDTGLVVEASQVAAAGATQAATTPVATGGPWDAVGRIAAAVINKQPPNIKAAKVADYVVDVLRDVRQKAEI